MRKTIFCLLWIIVWPCPEATADQITLTNGDRLTGAILEADGKHLRLQSELAGEVTVAWEAISQVSSTRSLAVTLSDERVLVGTLASADEFLEIREVDKESVKVSKETIQAIRTLEAQEAFERARSRRAGLNLLDFWQGTLDAGLASTRGNSDTFNFNLGLKAERTTPRDKFSAQLNSLFARDSTGPDAETTANAVRGGLRYERPLGKRLSSFVFSDLEFDELQQLDLRTVLGGGLGWRWRRTERTLFEIFAGGSFNQEFFENEPVRRSGEVLVGEDLTYKLSTRILFKERLTFFPNLNEGGEYRVTLDSSVETRLNERLSWQVTLSDRFLSNPPLGVQKNDLLLTTGIRLLFGEAPR